MRTALRKMGNSTGMIVPAALLSEIGISRGAALEISVENGRLVATPVEPDPRAGWAEAAAEIGRHDDPEAADWLAFRNESDADLQW